MTPLFLFGTLRHLPLLETVLETTSHLTLTPARLPGFAVSAVAEGPFPMIAAQSDAVAEGLLVVGLSAPDLARLDYYESAFSYALEPVALEDGQFAQAYVPPPGIWTPEGAWSLEDWARDWGPLSILAAAEVMSYHGQRPAADIAAMFPMIRARAWSRLNAQGSRHGVGTLHGAVEITDRSRPYAAYFAVEEMSLRHEQFDGSTSEEVRRAVFLAPDATLVLPYDAQRDRVLLVEQIRMGPLARGDRSIWQLEPIAGRLDPGESPETAARREAIEEAGLHMETLLPVAEVYCSPGNSTEFYYIFTALADLPDTVAGTGGLAVEHEDIRSHLLSFEALMALCDSREVANAPLTIAALWLARHRDRLRAEAGCAES